jgi:hypothetical protein
MRYFFSLGGAVVSVLGMLRSYRAVTLSETDDISKNLTVRDATELASTLSVIGCSFADGELSVTDFARRATRKCLVCS